MTKEELDAIMLERLRKEIPHLDAKLNSVTNNNADTISPQIKRRIIRYVLAIEEWIIRL